MEPEREAQAKEWASTRIADAEEVSRRLARPRATRRASPRPGTPLGKRIEREEAEASFAVRLPALGDDEEPGELPPVPEGGTPWDPDEATPPESLQVLSQAARILAGTVMTLAAIAAATLVVGPALIGYQVQPEGGRAVLETEIPVSEVNLGDVITFEAPTGEVVTRQVIQSVTAPGGGVSIRTRADGAAADPWLARLDGDTVWKSRASVPLAGHAVSALRALSPLLWTTLAAAMLVWVCALILNRPSRDPLRGRPRNIPGVAPSRSDLEADPDSPTPTPARAPAPAASPRTPATRPARPAPGASPRPASAAPARTTPDPSPRNASTPPRPAAPAGRSASPAPTGPAASPARTAPAAARANPAPTGSHPAAQRPSPNPGGHPAPSPARRPAAQPTGRQSAPAQPPAGPGRPAPTPGERPFAQRTAAERPAPPAPAQRPAAQRPPQPDRRPPAPGDAASPNGRPATPPAKTRQPRASTQAPSRPAPPEPRPSRDS